MKENPLSAAIRTKPGYFYPVGSDKNRIPGGETLPGVFCVDSDHDFFIFGYFFTLIFTCALLFSGKAKALKLLEKIKQFQGFELVREAGLEPARPCEH